VNPQEVMGRLGPAAGNSLYDSMVELANLLLITFLLLVAVLVFVTIWSMRDRKLREIRRKKREKERQLGEKLNLPGVLTDLTRNEMKSIAVEEKKRREKDDVINIEEYHALPLRPKVYFDPAADAAPSDEQPPEPKIKRSVLSNEPLPRESSPPSDEPVEWTPAEDAEKEAPRGIPPTMPTPLMPWGVTSSEDSDSEGDGDNGESPDSQ
jgi:hypothetical protein